jgi:hypothetical protein
MGWKNYQGVKATITTNVIIAVACRITTAVGRVTAARSVLNQAQVELR